MVGGTSGIGKSLVDELVEGSNSVYVMARNEPEKNQEDITFIEHDVLHSEFPSESVPETLSGVAYLPGSITLKPFGRTSMETFKEDWSLNVEGAIRVMQGTAKYLKKNSNSSNVVFFSTVAVHRGMKYHASIASAKAALEGLAKSLAAEWAPDVCVNVIAPSLTDTSLAESLLSSERKRENSIEKHPLKRIANPEQIASMAETLLVDDNHMTGEVVRMDGGLNNVE